MVNSNLARVHVESREAEWYWVALLESPPVFQRPKEGAKDGSGVSAASSPLSDALILPKIETFVKRELLPINERL